MWSRILYCSIILFVFSNSLMGQNTKLKGTVIDSTTSPLVGATVVLLQPIDSVMISFALSDNDGRFSLNNISPGKYYLQITYIGYGNFRQEIEVDSGKSLQDLGTIFLSPKNTLLEEVVVRAEHVPIVIKKDTIEYNADAFQTKPNAVVEDLLKRLPGVEVERDGSIKAQGEEVENVLVDGKEFFGNDPKIATQNLPAEVVDKVQVYDKQSEMAEFSGVDDGQEEKTINLSLKEDKKKGVFGNIEGGFGADDLKNISNSERYKAKLSINRFNNKLQFSVLGMANNINDDGFSFNDYINFMGGLGSMMSGNGGMALSLNSGDLGIPIGYGGTEGITDIAAGGINFNYDFSKRAEWQSSYFINRIDNNTIQDISSENLSTSKKFALQEDVIRNNINLNHRFNSIFRYKIDSTSNMTWINRISFNTGDLTSERNSQTLNDSSDLENESINSFVNDGSQLGWFSDLTLRKKLRKPGRIVSGKFNINLGDVSSNSLVENETSFYQNGMINENLLLYQDQISEEDQLQYQARLSYTEPLGNRTYLGINVNRQNFNNERIRNYFDIDPNDPSSRTLNLLLSNHYKRNYTYHSLGTNWKYVGDKLRFTANLDLQRSELTGDILSEGEELRKDFTYLLPMINIDYEMGSSKNIQFTYRTRVQEPSLEQLQPIVDNTNPLNLYVGNPELKPEYHHIANIHLMLFDQFSFTSFFGNINARYTKNKIVNQSLVDDQFRQFAMPINADQEFNANAYTSFSTPLKFMKSKISIDLSLNFNRGILFVNNLENNTNRWTNNYTLTIENRKKEHFDVAAGISLGTNSTKFSENPEFNQSYIDQTYFTDLALYLPKAWTFENSLDYTNYSEESFGDQDDLVIWKASISKGFLENERATIELSVFDILNQNKGINRRNSLNYIQEIRSNVLGRYVMLSLNYKLSKFGGNNNGMSVEFHKR